MEVSSPIEPVYYYECSAGRFRLTYFIPPEEMDRLIAADKLSAHIREDFPDGVDLDCTPPDFAAFERDYGYRPEVDPEELQAAFFAMFSSTRNWRRFRGTGLIPKVDLERMIEPVAVQLETEGAEPIYEGRVPPGLPHRERRRLMVNQVRQRARFERTLERMEVEAVDPKLDMRQQSFTEIKRSPGRPAAEIFDALHREQKGE
jgi:hypothetical protein